MRVTSLVRFCSTGCNSQQINTFNLSHIGLSTSTHNLFPELSSLQSTCFFCSQLSKGCCVSSVTLCYQHRFQRCYCSRSVRDSSHPSHPSQHIGPSHSSSFNQPLNSQQNFQKIPEFLENARVSRDCQNFQKMLEFLENARISRKWQNFQKMLEFLENAKISRKCQNCQKMLEFLENARVSRKCQNFQKMLEFLENARIFRKCQIFQKML